MFNFLQGFLAERASQGVAYDLRDALFAQIERLSFSYYDRVETGQLLTRVTNDVEQIRTFAGSGVVQLASALVMLVGSTVLLLLAQLATGARRAGDHPADLRPALRASCGASARCSGRCSRCSGG